MRLPAKTAQTGFLLIPIFIILDQLSKWLVLDYLFRPALQLRPLGFIEWLQNTERLPLISLDVLPFFNLTMVWNEGVSFGLMRNDTIWPLVLLALIIVVIFTIWLWRSKDRFESLSLAMVIGGALGNVIDRFHFGAVADFLDFYIGGWHYPAFNLADTLITVGIVMLVIHGLFYARKEPT